MSKDKILNIRIAPELKKAAKKASESDNRSLSNWVTWLIQRELKQIAKKNKKYAAQRRYSLLAIK